MRAYSEMCRNVHLDSACDQIVRILTRLELQEDEGVTKRELIQMNDELQNRIEDDFSHHLLFAVPRQDSMYYEQMGSLFDTQKVSQDPAERNDYKLPDR